MKLQEALETFAIEKATKTKITVDGVDMTPETLKKQIVKRFQDPELSLELMNSENQDIINACKKIVNAREQENLPAMDAEGAKVVREVLEKCEFVQDIRTGKHAFFNTESRQIVEIDFEVASRILGTDKKTLMESGSVVLLKFNPETPEYKFEATWQRKPVQAFNLFKQPRWRDCTPSNPKNIPKLILKLLNNVFPDGGDLDYFLSWAHYAVTSRNETILILIGAKGIGKTTVIRLLGQGVGKNYEAQADEGFFADKFTSSMHQKRLVVFEELVVRDQNTVNKLKRISNKEIKIESKGIDPTTENNTASLVIVNNYTNGLVGVEPSDRRFSVLEMGSTPLKEVFSEEEFEELSAMLDPDYEDEPHPEIVNFFHWLTTEYTPNYDKHTPRKGRYFYKVIWNSMPDWKREVVIEVAMSKGERVDLSKLRKEYNQANKGSTRGNLPINNTIREFVDSYEHLGKYKVAELIEERVKGTTRRAVGFLIPNQEFMDYVRTSDEFKAYIEEAPEVPYQTSGKLPRKSLTFEEKQAELEVAKESEEINGEEYL